MNARGQGPRDGGELPRGSVAYRRRRHPMEAGFPGTPLTAADLREGRVLTVEDRFAAEYAWDCGVAIGAYLEGLRQGMLLATACSGCGRVMVPPRTFCELCWRPVVQWRRLPGTGRVNTFSLCHVNWDASRRDEPLIPAVIELDGASPGMGILHLIEGIAPQEVEVGMAVEAAWRPEAERQGAITDIRCFVPAPRRRPARRRAPAAGKRSRKTAPGRRRRGSRR